MHPHHHWYKIRSEFSCILLIGQATSRVPAFASVKPLDSPNEPLQLHTKKDIVERRKQKLENAKAEQTLISTAPIDGIDAGRDCTIICLVRNGSREEDRPVNKWGLHLSSWPFDCWLCALPCVAIRLEQQW